MRTSGRGSEAPALVATPETQKPQIGDVLDSRYQITGVLGSGGMGCVYLAVHVSIQRPLALKLLHPEVGEIEEVTKRFEREAFAIGRMDHPNCVKVSDFGKLEDGTLYMVLELLDGVLLFDLLEQSERLHWRRALRIARHVLSALDYAHESGIIHRDIKPENVILVKRDDDPDFAKILDFGIAKIMHDDVNPEGGTLFLSNDAKLTQQGITIGTPTYIAPEQAYALPVDGRADLYSLSVMVYEMIAGVPPFDAEDIGALLRMHISSPVPPFEEMAPGIEVPEEVERMLRHGLAKKADDRIATAKEYMARIDAILVDEVEEGSGPRQIPDDDLHKLVGSLPPAAYDAPKPNRVRLALGSILVALALVGLGSIGWMVLAPPSPVEASLEAMSLGHAEARKDLYVPALVAYEKAISLDPKLAENKRMRDNVEQMIGRRAAPDVADAALEFLGLLYSVTDEEAIAKQLVDIASWSKIPRRRHTALRIANEVGLGDRVDLLASYTLDLQQADTCANRKAAIPKLRALGDKNAIPALRKARYRPRGGLGKKRVNTNACLRASANEAIKYLQSL